MRDWDPKANEIFVAAMEIESGDKRHEYIDLKCDNDDVLMRQVNSLVESAERAGSFLQAPLAATNSSDTFIDLAGTRIGPYKLLEILGEGGMGTVYMAEQSKPVKRRVAIKFIKPGFDTKQLIARFEAERQALALMEHPSIAKVFDAGTTDDGRPYFVMELVKGLPITKFCDEQKLPTVARLKLFRQVCQAVQHAHQKGIIHRDLKPSNIMIAMHDDLPVPKVIDFGVAKATGDSLTEETFFTRFGEVVGTLAYMSPEQAQFNQLDIDTRSDVYSLGAILYELLAGEPPFERERFESQAFDETLQMIREEEPAKPSTKLRSADSATQTASNRQTTPEKLKSIVRGDLDWIVMKALDKDRTRRYATADEFASEIGRFLNDEPVIAGPPSATYRFRKFARRNKTAIAFTIAIAASLFLGIIGTSWQAIRALDAARQAKEEADEATRQTKIAQAVQQFWNEDVLLQTDAFLRTIRLNGNISLSEVFDKAAEKIEGRFSEEPLVAAAIYEVLSTSYGNMHQYDRATEFVNREILIRESLLGVDDSTAINARSRLGMILKGTGQRDQAREILERELELCRQKLTSDDAVTISTLKRLASVYARENRSEEAVELLNESLPLEAKKHGKNSLRVFYTLAFLGGLHGKLGHHEEAERLFKKALAGFDELDYSSHATAGTTNHEFGLHLMGEKRFADALPYLRQAWILSKTDYGIKNPTTKKRGADFTACLNKLRRIDDERSVLKELISEYSDDLELKIQLAGNLCNSGMMATASGELEKSIELGQQAMAVLDEVLEQEPDNPQAIAFRTNTQNLLGHSLFEAGNYDQSVSIFQSAIESMEQNGNIVRKDDLERAFFQGLLYKYCGRSHEKLEQLEKAVQNYERANELLTVVMADKPKAAWGQLAQLLDWSEGIYLQLHQTENLLRTMDQVVKIIPEKAQHFRYSLLRELLRAYLKAVSKEYKQAVKIADEHCLEPTGEVETAWSGWLWAASAYSLSAKAVLEDQEIPDSERESLTDKYSEKAVGMLSRVLSGERYLTAGARKKLLEDEEYSVLRERADFQQLFLEK